MASCQLRVFEEVRHRIDSRICNLRSIEPSDHLDCGKVAENFMDRSIHRRAVLNTQIVRLKSRILTQLGAFEDGGTECGPLAVAVDAEYDSVILRLIRSVGSDRRMARSGSSRG